MISCIPQHPTMIRVAVDKPRRGDYLMLVVASLGPEQKPPVIGLPTHGPHPLITRTAGKASTEQAMELQNASFFPMASTFDDAAIEHMHIYMNCHMYIVQTIIG